MGLNRSPTMPFQIQALAAEPFQHLFALTSKELIARRMRRIQVDAQPGYPCRVSLRDADIGTSVILLNYTHHDAPTPYKASHAIYVCEGAPQARPAKNSIPSVFLIRPISLRGFDEAGEMVAADLAEGDQLSTAIETLFENKRISYIHLHNAKPGCFAARVIRV